MKCAIQWIDDKGQPTPDDNEAIGRVRTLKRTEWYHGRQIFFDTSDWYPICACHAKRLRDPGMHIWIFEEHASD